MIWSIMSGAMCLGLYAVTVPFYIRNHSVDLDVFRKGLEPVPSWKLKNNFFFSISPKYSILFCLSNS